MNLIVIIESAEFRFKQILEDFFISIYDEKSLTSHGIDHHRRVWEYSKELTLLMEKYNLIKDSSIPFQLIIACYLHDIGMSVDTGMKHGHHSRSLCIRFLRKNQIEESEYRDALFAIENHDNKEYRISAGENDLLTILSVADDLDAFGFIGIYRYIEIYIVRGIKPHKLGHLIRNNARKRFVNFSKSFAFSEETVRKHKKRFDILENFFTGYNKQVTTYQFGGKHPSGYCGVAEEFIAMSGNKTSLKDFMKDTANYSHDPLIRWFFDGLALELPAEHNQ
ncbi:MAG: hypothetical protein EPN88_13470 [Bacteroidetes bacterium]|nr:MAG: hypothetical protein EPN88_13470 [Bacteroidota bacterium]